MPYTSEHGDPNRLTRFPALDTHHAIIRAHELVERGVSFRILNDKASRPSLYP